VVGVIRRVVQGTSEQVESLLKQTQNTPQGHVAYIERLNGTFRSRIATLVRRGRSLARQSETLRQAMYLVGTVYNFCAAHKSLRQALYLPDNSRRWIPRTPAIAAGITVQIWSVIPAAIAGVHCIQCLPLCLRCQEDTVRSSRPNAATMAGMGQPYARSVII
jgi:hypothetical protein